MGPAVTGGLVLHAESLVLAFGVAPGFTYAISRNDPRWLFTALWVTAEAGGAVSALLGGDRADVVIYAAGALVALLWDWWRRNGKRVRKWLGAKTQALINGLAGKMRDAVRPPGQVPA